MSRCPWADADVAILRELYPHMRCEDIAIKLGRKVASVYAKAHALGLKKSEAFMQSPLSGRTDGTRGASSRFKPGQESWSKGKRLGPARGRAAETAFKKGAKPHNYAPIGSERLMQGYLQRKMTDTGYPPRDWKMVHVLLWEEHNGPVPAGHALVFRNGSRADIRLDNLELITRADLARRNTIHRYPPEVKDSMRLLGRIKREVRKQQEKANG